MLKWENMQVLSSDTVFSVPMADTYNLLGVDSKDIITLEKYLQDYFSNILKKLKDLKAQSKQTDIYFWKIIYNIKPSKGCRYLEVSLIYILNFVFPVGVGKKADWGCTIKFRHIICLHELIILINIRENVVY